MTTRIVQLVPCLDDHSGVANHAKALASGLAARDIATDFVVADGLLQPGPSQPARRLHRHDATELASALGETDGDAVILHYANYGYQPRGCPRWLVAGLERWRAAGGRHLVTAFHELYATGRPWQSSFWLSPVQRQLAARAARMSTGAVTSLELYTAKLRAWSPRVQLATLPVFSTVGETMAPRPVAERRPELVVFGSAGVRSRGYTLARAELAAACRALAIETIVDVGPGDPAPERVGGVPVRRAGFLHADDVGTLLADSRAGFVCYPREYLGKSTIFAAYCAHAVVPVCVSPDEGMDGATPPHWPPTASAAAADWQDIANRAHAWYGDHSLARHAQVYASLLQ
jgi:hypothetical protein